MYKKFTKKLGVPDGCVRQLLRIMRLTTVILIATFMQVSAAGYAQRVTLNEHNASLETVLKEIRQQTGYDMLFDRQLVLKAPPVTLNIKDVALSDALTKILADQPLDFVIEDKTITIKAKEQSFLNNNKTKLKAELSQITAMGKVVDGTGQPIPGVNVREKGTQNGTVTDSKGKYSLSVTDDKSIITFSYIGYETQELRAKDLPDGSAIVLKAAENNLQEVVISKGYYNEKQELSTGDVSVVTAKIIGEQPVSDPIQALIGRVPGLNIQQTSGIPGAYATIQIRGQSSIANGNDPLYVIDGVPFSSASLNYGSNIANALRGSFAGNNNSIGNSSGGAGVSPFNALNPNDIESIEVLKDADATSIYGSRGANGVVLITTKKGKVGDTKFTLDASQGAGSVGHFMDLLNTQQYLQMRHQAFANDGIAFPSITTNPSDNNYDVNGVWDTTRYTNWQKAMIGGTAQWTNIQGNLSGGNANTQFLIGGGYNRQTTVFPGDFELRVGIAT
jgi:TonB-dependent SusC/RagA subfamily outer membrane receptor